MSVKDQTLELMLEVDETRLGQYLKDGYATLIGYYGDGSGAATGSSRGVQVRSHPEGGHEEVGSGRDRMYGLLAFAREAMTSASYLLPISSYYHSLSASQSYVCRRTHHLCYHLSCSR